MIPRDAAVTIEKTMELTGLDRATIYRKLGSGELIPKTAEEKSGNGKPKTLILVSSLPLEAQVRYWQNALAPAAGDKPTINLAEVPKASLDEALRRHPFVLRALAIIDSRAEVSNQMEALAAEAGETPRTLYRWVAAWEKDGIGMPGLLPKWGKKKKGTFTAITPDLDEYIHSYVLTRPGPAKPSPAEIFKAVQDYCATPGITTPCPCVNTINKFLSEKVRYSALVLAREGPRAWAAKCMPKIHRDPMKVAVGEVWVGDHREMDVLICLRIVKKDGEVEILKFRPWLTAWYDVHSRKCVGYVVVRTPNSRSIALALHDAISKHGVPKSADGGPGLLYVDNGKDYKSYYLNGNVKLIGKIDLPSEVKLMLGKGVLHPLGIEIQHAKPYAAWQKPIEQWFGHTFPKWEATLPGWTGRDAKHRPEKLAGEIDRDELLELHDFEARLADCIEAYHSAGHGGVGMEGASPDSFWVDKPIDEIDPRVLDIMLMPHKPVKVTHQGIQLFGTKGNRRYYRHQVLKNEHVGHYVDVRYNPNDLSYVIVFKNNEFLCVAPADDAWSIRPNEDQLKAHRKSIAIARRETERVIDNHRMLMDPAEHLRRRVMNETNPKAVGPRRDPKPAAGTIARHSRVASIERNAFTAAADALTSLNRKREARTSPAPEAAPDARAAEHDALHDELMSL